MTASILMVRVPRAMTKHLRFSPILVLSLVTLGCGGAMPAGDPELTCDTGAATVTLTGDVQAVFDAKCKSCHGAGYMYGDYSTAQKTHSSTVGVKSLYAGDAGMMKIVDPQNLANSSLWLKVLGGDAANRKGPRGERTFGAMPNDGTMLTDAQKKLLKDWICTGAGL